MLDHFRALTAEAGQCRSNNQTLESEARSTRSALRDAEAKIADLEHIVQNKDALIAGCEEQVNLCAYRRSYIDLIYRESHRIS
jgi:hypothetical protein